MDKTISKLSLSAQAKDFQIKSKISYMQSLNIASQKHGYTNYQHFNATKKAHIAFFNTKGGVGKSTISRTIAKDINAGHYLRTDFRFQIDNPEGEFFQIFPNFIKQKNNNFINRKELTVYDLCELTDISRLGNIIKNIDLFIIPYFTNDGMEPDFFNVKRSIKVLDQYNTPILLLGIDRFNNRKRTKWKKIFEEYFRQYRNIHFFYIEYSDIFRDYYLFDLNSKELREKPSIKRTYLITMQKVY